MYITLFYAIVGSDMRTKTYYAKYLRIQRIYHTEDAAHL